MVHQLFNRQNSICYVADKKSDIQKITCGVSQGSVLGPLLFIAFANDICNASELLFYILYADDTAVLLKGKELRELLVILNEELERINLWLKANKQGWGQVQLTKYSSTPSTLNIYQVQVLVKYSFFFKVLKYIKYFHIKYKYKY